MIVCFNLVLSVAAIILASTQKYKLRDNILLKIFTRIIKFYLKKKQLDMVCGDGDCGNSLSSVSNVILNAIENKNVFLDQRYRKV